MTKPDLVKILQEQRVISRDISEPDFRTLFFNFMSDLYRRQHPEVEPRLASHYARLQFQELVTPAWQSYQKGNEQLTRYQKAKRGLI